MLEPAVGGRADREKLAGAVRLRGVTTPTTTCAQCGATVPDLSGPVHRYVPSAPGCWQIFGEVQADESLRFGYPAAHRIVVNAYMAQHPGDGSDRRDRQSVFAHLAGLCAVVEMDMDPAHATEILRRVLKHYDDFPVLDRRHGPGELNVVHLIGARDAAEYERRARAWARTVWQAWDDHHTVISEAVRSALS